MSALSALQLECRKFRGTLSVLFVFMLPHIYVNVACNNNDVQCSGGNRQYISYVQLFNVEQRLLKFGLINCIDNILGLKIGI